MERRYSDTELQEMVGQLVEGRSREEVIATLQDDLYGASREHAERIVDRYNEEHPRYLVNQVEEATEAEQIIYRYNKEHPKSLVNQTEEAIEQHERPGRSLEIIAQDLKKVKEVVSAVPLAVFSLPTLIRKISQVIDDETNSMFRYVIPGVASLFSQMVLYGSLAKTNPKLALTLGLAQIGTNLASGIYEYVKHVREQMKK